MAFFNFIETFFFISLGITFVLVLLLVYHFKQRVSGLEHKCDTMFEIINDIVKQMNTVRMQNNVPFMNVFNPLSKSMPEIQHFINENMEISENDEEGDTEGDNEEDDEEDNEEDNEEDEEEDDDYYIQEGGEELMLSDNGKQQQQSEQSQQFIKELYIDKTQQSINNTIPGVDTENNNVNATFNKYQEEDQEDKEEDQEEDQEEDLEDKEEDQEEDPEDEKNSVGGSDISYTSDINDENNKNKNADIKELYIEI